MQVTLDIFSGRMNPRWRLTETKARVLRDRVSGAQPVPPQLLAGGLGFRGFVVETEPGDPPLPPGLPRRFRIARQPQEDALPFVKEKDAFDLLLDEAERVCDGAIVEVARKAPAEWPEIAAQEATRESRGEDRRWQSFVPRTIAAPEGGSVFASPYWPLFWNQPAIRPYNNCYNYAVNFASNTVAQPGRRGGKIYDGFSCGALVAAGDVDGLLTALTEVAGVVALAIWPGMDFHFWRLHPGGLWAHKLGVSTARNYDNAARVIAGGRTPETCARAPYTDFCGYFFVPLGTTVF